MDTQQTRIGGVIIAIVVIIILGVFLYKMEFIPYTTNPSIPAQGEITISDGTISFSQPTNFGLAVTPEQILVQSYIPSCESGFSYCLYYNANTYAGTNFDAAGIAIRKRTDLTSENACLTTQPEGYTDLSTKSQTYSTYAISSFAPIGDAGAGHYSTGEEYRVYTNNTCYQFDTRVGESQFANYPTGTITEFTATDRAALLENLRSFVRSITIGTSTTGIVLP